MTTITIITTPVAQGVDSRAYVNGVSLIGPDGQGEPYHMGQISSSIGWAHHDMVEHFKDEYDKMFPDGWEVVFA